MHPRFRFLHALALLAACTAFAAAQDPATAPSPFGAVKAEVRGPGSAPGFLSASFSAQVDASEEAPLAVSLSLNDVPAGAWPRLAAPTNLALSLDVADPSENAYVWTAAPADAAGAAAAAPRTATGRLNTRSLTGKMMFLALQIGIILFAAKMGGILAEACKLPSVIGELGAGIVIGPYALGSWTLGGLVPGGVFGGFPPGGEMPVTPELYGFCTIASIVLLFLSGVETNFKMFLRYAFSGSIVGVGGVVVSFLFGDLCAVALLPRFFPDVPAYAGLGLMSPAALFMGIMSTATSVGITARILSERRVMDGPEGTTTMAAAVIDDVLGIIVLAIGMGVIASQKGGGAAGAGMDWGKIGLIAARAFGIWLGATAVGLLAARKISNTLKLFKDPVAIATLAFGLSIILSGFFQAAGLSLIIGAYVMGLSLSRTDIRHLIQENLQAIYTFLVPVFFCVMGMMVDVEAVAHEKILVFGAIYTLLCIAAKVLGCAVPAAFCGFNALGSLRIGVGMIPRGEVALIIAGIGLSNGYLDNEVFSIGILMTLVTTIVPPPVLVSLFSNPRRGTRKADAKNADSAPRVYRLPNAETAELLLEKLIGAFRAEGFFTALLNPRENIWQLARDTDDIIVSLHGSEIHIECTPAEEPIVAAALLDVTAEMSALAQALSKPIAPQGMRPAEGAAAGAAGSADAEVSRRLKAFLYLPRLAAADKKGAIEELCAALAAKGLVADAAEAAAAVFRREEAMTTGLEHGIAIPHARTAQAKTLVGAVALAPDGLADYATMDGAPVRIVVLTLSPADGHSPHLRLIARVGQVLGEDGRKALLAATTPEAMQAVFLHA